MKKTSNMVKIGEIKILTGSEEVVWTILGSCISVIFYTNNMSMICHAQMPKRGTFDSICADSCPHPCYNFLPDSCEFKYVSCSLEYMIETMKQYRINPQEIKASLVGGASVLFTNGKIKPIGEQNIEIAKEILRKNKIRINREIIGGNDGITLWFYADTNRLIYQKHKSEEKIELLNGQFLR